MHRAQREAGAIKAIDASRIAMIGDGTHVDVNLDTVIATMLQNGRDMRDKYKETSKERAGG